MGLPRADPQLGAARSARALQRQRAGLYLDSAGAAADDGRVLVCVQLPPAAADRYVPGVSDRRATTVELLQRGGRRRRAQRDRQRQPDQEGLLPARSAAAGQRVLQLGELPAFTANDVFGHGRGAAAVPATPRARPAQLRADDRLPASADRHPDALSIWRGAVHERTGGAFPRFRPPDRDSAPVLVFPDAGGLLARRAARLNRRCSAGTSGTLAE